MHEHVSVARDDDVGIAHNLNINREYVFSVVEYMLSFRWGVLQSGSVVETRSETRKQKLKKKNSRTLNERMN